jgi:hypothetical protein
VIDTLARCFEGDENQQEDMGRFVAGVDRLRRELTCTVLIVHHTRLDGDRERGNTAFRGAADAMISVKRKKGPQGTITVSNDKQKDAEEFAPLQFALEIVPEYQSCVIQPSAGASRVSAFVFGLKQLGMEPNELYSATEIHSLTSMSRATFFRVLRETVKTGKIVKEKGKYALVG